MDVLTGVAYVDVEQVEYLQILKSWAYEGEPSTTLKVINMGK